MIVRGIVLKEHAPSVISAGHLYCWIKYCVGEHRGDNYRYGAVKPPDSQYAWFPAAISQETILIANTKSFPTPEKAVGWLRAAGQAGRKSRRRSKRTIAQRARGSR